MRAQSGCKARQTGKALVQHIDAGLALYGDCQACETEEEDNAAVYAEVGPLWGVTSRLQLCEACARRLHAKLGALLPAKDGAA